MNLGGRFVNTFVVSAFRSEEQVAMAPDDWLAVVHVNPYRVDWIDQAGSVHEGPVLAVEHVRASSADRRLAAADGLSQWGAGIWASVDSSGPKVRIPPFGVSALHICDDRGVFIERVLETSRAARIYDHVDRRGVVDARLSLGRRERLIGCNATHYAVVDRREGGRSRLQIFKWRRTKTSSSLVDERPDGS